MHRRIRRGLLRLGCGMENWSDITTDLFTLLQCSLHIWLRETCINTNNTVVRTGMANLETPLQVGQAYCAKTAVALSTAPRLGS